MPSKLFCSLCQVPLREEEIELTIEDEELKEVFIYCKSCAVEFHKMVEEELKREKKIHLNKDKWKP